MEVDEIAQLIRGIHPVLDDPDLTTWQAYAARAWPTLVVLDPVLICKGQEPGAALDTDNALREKILPLATVATPNYFEACTLAGMDKLETVQDLAEAAERISKLGPRYVVVKGGIDFPGEEAVDVLWDGENATAFSSPKIGEHRVSGAGCTLAAAITAELAKGTNIHDAVRIANDSRYGLAGNVMAGSVEHALAVASRLRAGFIGINGTAGYGADTPFGGYKASGVGRQNGVEGFRQYTEVKSVAYPAQ